VQYTSPTDAVAEFEGPKSDDRVIATTDDNWAHASGLLISWDLADLVDYLPLGRGAVAIKAKSQFGGMSSPPFVLYPSGEVKPLRVTEPRALDADSELLKIDLFDFLYAIGAEEESDGLWAADVEAAEVFPLAGSPSGHVWKLLPGGSPPDHLWQHVPGRDGALVSVSGYQRDVDDGVWRFETSTDMGQSWHRTDVRLPIGRTSLYGFGVSTHAVGPAHLQAIAVVDYRQDGPLSLRELWRTDDEKEFRRVHLPWERMFFGGIAFAADGALLLAEVAPATHCQSITITCNLPGSIWRLPPEGTEMRLLSDAPGLFGPFWAVGIETSGGVIVARTGLRTIAVSKDGYTWTKVSPGR
jgi:hypothetical protein